NQTVLGVAACILAQFPVSALFYSIAVKYIYLSAPGRDPQKVTSASSEKSPGGKSSENKL
ncbi:MAG: hypothetical protein ACOC7U_08290, partial [Spirochaetota bacterium]